MITFKKSVYILQHFKTFRLTIPHPDIFNPSPKACLQGFVTCRKRGTLSYGESDRMWMRTCTSLTTNRTNTAVSVLLLVGGRHVVIILFPYHN